MAGAMTMNFHLFDLAGFIGVLLIVVAYLLLQLDKLPSSSPRYSLMNAAGALLIIVSLVFKFNLSAFIVETFWFLISLLGLWRALISRKNSQLSAGINGKASTEVRGAEVRVRVGACSMSDRQDRIPKAATDRRKPRRSRARARSRDSSVAAPSAAPE